MGPPHEGRAPFFQLSKRLRAQGDHPAGVSNYAWGPFAQQQLLRSGTSRDDSSPREAVAVTRPDVVVRESSGPARTTPIGDPSTQGEDHRERRRDRDRFDRRNVTRETMETRCPEGDFEIVIEEDSEDGSD